MSLSLEPGTMVGQYRIQSLLGEGGMGAVYYAEHVVLGRPAAIKVLLQHIARNAGLVQRFVNEGRVAAAMNHRNVVDVLDCGQFPSPDAPNAQWYIALEFLQGMSLAKFIADRGGQPTDLPTILHILGEAANGLHAAHEKQNLVHRDVKPDNLFIIQTEDDPMRVKILDFGIAKLRQPGSGVQTLSQTAMGTPAYAAPEQLRESKDVDRRADVWALGVIAHEMATGVRPWGATVSVYQIIAHHAAMKKPPDPRAMRSDLPKKWAEVVSKAMEPNPDRRWASARDFARALAEATPMPFSANGMTVLEKCAKELTTASSHSLTVGRPLPPELRLDPAEIATAPGRPAAAKAGTMSDGVPRLPGARDAAPPGTAPMSADSDRPRTQRLPDESRHPISTIAGSAGQSVAAPATPYNRRRLLAAATIAGAIAIAVFVALFLARGSSGDSGAQEHATAAADAGAPRATGAAQPTMSALAIITEPSGGQVFVDGVPKGSAPLNLQFPVGAALQVRAELAGHAPASTSVRVAAAPTTVRLNLPAVVDAGVPSTSSTGTPKTDRDGTSSGKRRPAGPRKGTSPDPTFDPNDVL